MDPKIIIVDDANRALREMTAQAVAIKAPGVLSIETPAEKEEKALRQSAIMNNFFSKLNGREQRGLRAVSRRLSRHKESFAEMAARLTRPQFAPVPPPGPSPKSSDDDQGEAGAGA